MWRGNKRILFQVFSIQKITEMLLSNHHLSLCTKLMAELNKENWLLLNHHLSLCTKLMAVLNKENWQSMK